MTGYLVRYVDLREPKPHSTHEDVYVLDKDALAALGLMGLNALFMDTMVGIKPPPYRVAHRRRKENRYPFALCQEYQQSIPVHPF